MTELEITQFTKDSGPLTKRISLCTDGSVRSDSGACRMARGEAKRLRLNGLAGLAAVIDAMRFNEAIALGSLRDGLPERSRPRPSCSMVSRSWPLPGPRATSSIAQATR